MARAALLGRLSARAAPLLGARARPTPALPRIAHSFLRGHQSWSASGSRSLCAQAAQSASSTTGSEPGPEAVAEAAAAGAEEGTDDAAEAAQEGADAGAEEAVEEAAEDLATLLASEQAKAKDLHDQLLRSYAEMENVRHIAKRDAEAARKYGVQKFAKSLLDVADNLHRAVDSVDMESVEDPQASLTALLDGVTMTSEQLTKVFGEFGVVRFGEVGDEFDSQYHDALFAVESPDKEPNTILEVVQTGYMLHDRVIRAAQVGTVKPAA